MQIFSSAGKTRSQNPIRGMKGVNELNSDSLSNGMKGFYQDNPFPYFDLEEYPTFDDLKRRASGYVRRLDQSISSQVNILEVGCGTGQLTNYLAHLPTRQVIGVDLSAASLDLGMKLRSQLGFKNLSFIQADLFNLPFSEESFDVIICHGVLHHTGDPDAGFCILTRLLKRGGDIAIGLYHRLGRRRHWAKAKHVQKSEETNADPKAYPRVFESDMHRGACTSWHKDQFFNPHESGHLLMEIAGWFRKSEIIITGSVPSFEIGDGFWSEHPFFSPDGLAKWQRNRLLYFITDLKWWIKPVENGYFIVFGKKKDLMRFQHDQ